MGTCWKIDKSSEGHAKHLAKQEWHDRHFFEALEKQAPIKVKL